jgi:hypothetical protein
LAGERQKRKRRQAERAATRGGMAKGYERGRRKDEAARQALKPLPPGERPGAVTVGAIAAAVGALANLVSMIVLFDPDSPNKSALSIFGIGILIVVAVGMWRARYWAVLGMQTVLLLTILFATLALPGAGDAYAVILLAAILALAGTLFWFLVKAMARIQMPPRPGASR